jgi:excisionase family DNA binding protein
MTSKAHDVRRVSKKSCAEVAAALDKQLDVDEKAPCPAPGRASGRANQPINAVSGLARSLGPQVLPGRLDAAHHLPRPYGMAARARSRGRGCQRRGSKMSSRTAKPRKRSTSKGTSGTNRGGTQRRPLTKLRTIEETADLLNVSPRTVRRLIDSGALPVHRFGRRVRIAEWDIAVLLSSTRSF